MSDNYKDMNENPAADVPKSSELDRNESVADISPELSDKTMDDTSSQAGENTEESVGKTDQHTVKEATASNKNADEALRWDYAGREDDNVKIEIPKRKRSRGGIVFALIMVCVFTIALAMLLIFTLIEGPNAPGTEGGYELDIEQATGVMPEGSFATSETLEQTKNSVVLIVSTTSTGRSTGSGFILDTRGLIVTNQHVIENANSITVTLYDGNKYNATVVGESARDDLALLKIDAGELRPATLARSENLKLGETVYAIGAPGGEEFAWSVTRGSVSHTLRNISVYDDEGTLEKRMNVIQTDTAVNHGNSGGPLINSAGQVVGIVVLKLADDYDGMGFAIPIDGALEILNELAANGKVDGSNTTVSSPRPLMGITGITVEAGSWYSRDSIKSGSDIVPVDSAIASKNPDAYFYAEVTGALVASFAEDQDAKNKLQVYDIITEVNGTPVSGIRDVVNIINKLSPGDSIEVVARRNGKDIKTNILLGSN